MNIHEYTRIFIEYSVSVVMNIHEYLVVMNIHEHSVVMNMSWTFSFSCHEYSRYIQLSWIFNVPRLTCSSVLWFSHRSWRNRRMGCMMATSAANFFFSSAWSSAASSAAAPWPARVVPCVASLPFSRWRMCCKCTYAFVVVAAASSICSCSSLVNTPPFILPEKNDESFQLLTPRWHNWADMRWRCLPYETSAEGDKYKKFKNKK